MSTRLSDITERTCQKHDKYFQDDDITYLTSLQTNGTERREVVPTFLYGNKYGSLWKGF